VRQLADGANGGRTIVRTCISTDHHSGAGRDNIAVVRQEPSENGEVVAAPVAGYESASIEQVTRIKDAGRVLERIRNLHDSIYKGKGPDAMELLMDGVE